MDAAEAAQRELRPATMPRCPGPGGHLCRPAWMTPAPPWETAKAAAAAQRRLEAATLGQREGAVTPPPAQVARPNTGLGPGGPAARSGPVAPGPGAGGGCSSRPGWVTANPADRLPAAQTDHIQPLVPGGRNLAALSGGGRSVTAPCDGCTPPG